MSEILPDEAAERQPFFNLPVVVTALLAVLVLVHVVRTAVLSDAAAEWVFVAFAFIPARYVESGFAFPGGVAGDAWTFLTYAFLHADVTHLAMNAVWLAAFGSPLAWRFGTGRFLLLSAGGAVAGAALFLALHFGEPSPVVGASAAISAQMAAASRFVFAAGGPLGGWQGRGRDSYRMPASSFAELLTDRRFLSFTAAWFAVNLVIGLVGIGGGMTVAWDAHIGGYLAGLALFPLLDPISSEPIPAA